MILRLIIISLVVLSPSLYTQNARPIWVNNIPFDSDFFQGVGSVSLKESNFIDKAREQALLSISRSISTSISSSSKRRVLEINDIESVDEYLSEYVLSSVSNLNNVELVEEFQDKKNYYVWYRYSKLEHQKSIQNASDKALDFYDNFTRREEYEVNEKLSDLVKAFENLQFTYGNNVSYTKNNKDINLWVEIPSQLESIMRMISVKTLTDNIKAIQGNALEVPLEADISIILPPPYSKIAAVNLPVVFKFIEGGGDFIDPIAYVDESGKVTANISKITSFSSRQSVEVSVNLSSFKESNNPFEFFDNSLKKISDYSKAFFEIEVSEKRNDVIAIYVKSSEGFSEVEVLDFNKKFEQSFSQLTEFEIKDRTQADRVLNQRGQTSLDVCDSYECRVAIKDILKIDKFLIIDMISSSGIVEAEFRLLDDKIIDNIKTIDKRITRTKFLNSSKNYIDQFSSDYYKTLNPARVSFSVRNVNSQVNFYVNGQYTGRVLPIIDYRIEEHGSHTFGFESTGYEKFQKKYTLTPQSTLLVNDEIKLNKKTRLKAFSRSLLFPGRGQNYSADPTFPGRKNTGRLFTLAGFTVATASLGSWAMYINSKNEYDEAYQTYKNAKLLDDINTSRENLRKVHSNMTTIQSVAIGVSSAYAGLWFISAFEALIGFPKYSLNDNDIHFAVNQKENNTELTINVSF